MQKNKIFLEGIKQFDLFAQPLQLLVDKKVYHQTLYGSFLTLLLLALFSNLFYQKLVTLFDKSNPSSLSSEIYHSQPELYTLTPFNFTMTMAFQNSTYNTYIDESVYVVNAYLVKKIVKESNGQKIDVFEKQELPLVECNQNLIQQEELKEYFSHIDLPNNYCIDWNQIPNIQIQGTFDAPKFEFIAMQINTCTEQTQKSKPCKSQKEIEEKLKQNYFSFQISSYTTNLKNPNSPYQPKGQDLFTTISNNIYKEISIYLEPLTTITDVGLIQTDLEYEKTLRYGRHTEMLDLNQSDLIMSVIIRLDTTEYIDYRTYPKIQEILAELGGLWQVLFCLFYIISKPINKISLLLELINSLYEYQDVQQQEEDSSLNKNEKPGSPLQRQIEQVQIYNEQIVTNKTLSIKDNICKNQDLKDKSFKTILQTYVLYIQKTLFRKNKKYKFGYLNAFQALRCIVTKDDENIIKFREAHQEISSQLNVFNILKRLQDVEKLKHILFNDNQLILFEKSKNILQKAQSFDVKQNSDQQIKQQGMTQDAILHILSDQNNEINQKLVASIDVTVSNLLRKCKQENLEKSEKN
ncbi:unnamed protein product (macronuclear) [Paramecium tetraurelia]|uniref:Transmembrane protein n=1 Tax=Paramecium tetraurelia TaxID=5888 RepID=A0DBH5_PARTE|nr:uncharacterized protein GSPATT00015287001 [Paramecium tetraurelia]CAK80392.1 unnamed protein product [Paramecium tetraurelia]|eukprot:XP_001447789.1 hypothetical protein (macronuclear) [Paramecium tetraurelia strain d4-2]